MAGLRRPIFGPPRTERWKAADWSKFAIGYIGIAAVAQLLLDTLLPDLPPLVTALSIVAVWTLVLLLLILTAFVQRPPSLE